MKHYFLAWMGVTFVVLCTLLYFKYKSNFDSSEHLTQIQSATVAALSLLFISNTTTKT